MESVVDVLVDTNVILRRLHRAHPQHRQAHSAIKKLSVAGNRICVTSQNLIEFWAVCSRPVVMNGFGLDPANAHRVVARVESSTFRLPESDGIYSEWRRLVFVNRVSGKEVHDTRLVAAMSVNGITHILIFNIHHFDRYTGITVLDPAAVA